MNPNKEFEIRKFFKKHFLKILLIFVVWSFIYAFINVTPLISDNKDTSEILSVFFTNWAKGEYHMGFLIWLLAFYIAVPMYRLICEKIKVVEYFLIIWLISSCVISSFNTNEIIKGYYQPVLNLMSEGAGYFLLGYYFSVKEISKNKRKIIYILGTLSVMATILGTYYLSKNAGTLNRILWGYGNRTDCKQRGV